MLNITKTILGFIFVITLSFFSTILFPSSHNLVIAAEKTESDTEYQLTQWTDLIPVKDLAALLNPPSAIDNIMDGSNDDSLEKLEQMAAESDYGKALKSMNIIPEFNQKKIRIPGFVVPIDSDEDQRITEFFLVPYFGACLHLPPPPPNQIIYGKYSKGLKVDVLYDPFWVEGTVRTEVTDIAIGTSAYTMQIDNVEEYDE